MLVCGKVCANPNNPAPMKDTIEAPIVQNNAILFGCDFSPFRYIYTANNAIAKNASGSNAEKIPPTINQILLTPM